MARKRRRIYKWTGDMRAFRQEFRAAMTPNPLVEMLDLAFDAQLADLEARVAKLERKLRRPKPKKRIR